MAQEYEERFFQDVRERMAKAVLGDSMAVNAGLKAYEMAQNVDYMTAIGGVVSYQAAKQMKGVANVAKNANALTNFHPLKAVAGATLGFGANIYEYQKMLENPDAVVRVANERVVFLEEMISIYGKEKEATGKSLSEIMMDRAKAGDRMAQEHIARFEDIQMRFAEARGQNMLSSFVTTGTGDFMKEVAANMEERYGVAGKVGGYGMKALGWVTDQIADGVEWATRKGIQFYRYASGRETTIDEMISKQPMKFTKFHQNIYGIDQIYEAYTEKEIAPVLKNAQDMGTRYPSEFSQAQVAEVANHANGLFADPYTGKQRAMVDEISKKIGVNGVELGIFAEIWSIVEKYIQGFFENFSMIGKIFGAQNREHEVKMNSENAVAPQFYGFEDEKKRDSEKEMKINSKLSMREMTMGV